MAFVCIVVDVPADSIDRLNSDLQRPTKPHEAVVELKDMCQAILAGAKDASVQITTRDTDPAISTSGSGSQQESYNLK